MYIIMYFSVKFNFCNNPTVSAHDKGSCSKQTNTGKNLKMISCVFVCLYWLSFLFSPISFKRPIIFLTDTLWNEIFAGVYFCGLAVFCVLWELIFAIRTDWFFLLGINFCDFRKYPVPSIDNIVVFIEYVQQKYIFSDNTKCASVFL